MTEDEHKTKQQLIAELQELRRRVAELGEAESRARNLMETVPLGIAECDTEGVITLANSAYERMMGYSEGELLGMRVADLLQEGPEREAIRQQFKRLLIEQPAPSPYQCKDVTKDGRLVDVQVDWGYRRDPQGRVTGFMSIISNITERKRAEEELARHRAMLEATIESLPFDFWMLADGRYVLQNAASRMNWADSIGKSPEEVGAPPETLAIWQANNRRALLGEKVEEEVRLVVEGEERFIYNVITPVQDQTRTYGILGMNIDITQRKRAEAELRKARDELERRVEQRTSELAATNDQLRIFRRFAETAGQAFAMSDFDYRIRYANPAMLRLCGEEKLEDVLGQSFLKYYPGDFRSMLEQQMLSGVGDSGGWEGELSFLSRDGRTKTVLANGFQIRDETGTPLSLAVVMTDITELKQAQNELKASEERFRVAFEEAPLGMVMGGGDGLLYKANQAICRMGGYREEEMVGRLARDFTHPEDRNLTLGPMQQLLAGEIPRFTVEKRYLRKDGTAFWAQATVAAVRGPDGKITFALGMVEDITERKAAQAALEREHRTLKHLLQSSDHERQLIAYEIHDGLAQQLAGAVMQFQTYEHLKESRPKQAAKAFEAGMTMLQQGHQETRRLISGVRPPILDEAGIVAAISHLVNEEKRKNGPSIEYASDVAFDRLTPILENAIYRVVQEALTNACRHSKSRKIRVVVVQQGEQIRIDVEDHGVGFKPDDVGESRFGLEGIRERARLLGGTCEVESTPGKGTRIVVQLPIVLRRPDDELPGKSRN